MRRERTVFADLDAISRAAADAIEIAAHRAVATRGRFTLALSGGSTPRALLQLMAAEYRARIPWAAADLFFGDERCVPPAHPDSNFGMARDALLQHIDGLEARTHRIVGELGPDVAATDYGRLLRTCFPGADAVTFDVVLLGIGTDGHTASLFPGSPVLDERRHWVMPAEAPPEASTRARVTLTYPALNAALEALILCAGATKRPILSRLNAAGLEAEKLFPVARVRARKRVWWLIDRAADPS